MTRTGTTIIGLAAALSLTGAASAQTVRPVPEATSDIATSTAADYRSRARLPDWITPLAPGDTDPVMAKRVPTTQRLANADGLALGVRCSDVRYEAGDIVTVYAELDVETLLDADMPERPGRRQRLDGRFDMKGIIAGRIAGTVAEIVLRDDGLGRDERRGDGVYTASFVLDERYRPDIGYSEALSVIVTADDGKGETVKAVGGFLYSHPAAYLTGQFRDRINDGDLIIEAEVDVTEAGRFHLAGTIENRRGDPLMAAQSANRLEPGRHWMTLEFYGLALSESKAAGRLTLGSVTLTSAGGMPNALGPVLEDAHRTAPYRARDFHTRPFNDASMAGAAERLEAIAKERRTRGQ